MANKCFQCGRHQRPDFFGWVFKVCMECSAENWQAWLNTHGYHDYMYGKDTRISSGIIVNG